MHESLYNEEENIEFSEELSLFYLMAKKFVNDYTPYTTNSKKSTYGVNEELPASRFQNDVVYMRRLLRDLAKKSDKLVYDHVDYDFKDRWESSQK